MSTGYIRVTITSERRNVEMLLPGERQVAAMMPEILDACGRSSAAETPQALALTPLGSSTLRPHQTLEDAGVDHGAVLSLDRRDEAVPRPVIYDLAEETEQLSAPINAELTVDLRRLSSTAVFVLFSLLALLVATDVFDAATRSWWSLAAAGISLVALAVMPRRVLDWDVELLGLSGAALALTYYWGLAPFPWSEWTIPGWLVAVGLSWLAARRLWLSLVTTALAALALAVLWWGSFQLIGTHREVVAVAGIGSVVLLGLAPRLALTASGMHRLDDDVASGERPSVPRARTAFVNAHTGLSAAVVLCAISAAVAVHGLVQGGYDRWTLPLAMLVAVLTAIRARSMPLALERAALITSASISTIVILRAVSEQVPGWLLLLVPVLLALIPAMLRLLTVPAHHGAQLRIYARRLEGLATLALVPLLVGLFGLYSQLIDTFQG